jgi:hypothetical protein
MAACNLSIELESETKRFHPGEQVRGVVTVRCDEPCRCDGLKVTLGWVTHGKGNEALGQEASALLFVGQWEAGTHSYPFRFMAPDGPLTYRGTLLNVDWHVEVRADVPWAIDPKASEDVLLVPWTDADLAAQSSYRFAPAQPHDSYSHGPALKSAGQERQDKQANVGCAGIAGLLFLVVGALLMLLWQKALSFGAMFVLSGLIAGGYWLRHWLANRSLGGAPTVSFDKNEAELGGTLRVQAAFSPPRETVIERASAELLCSEIVVRGSGTDKKTFRQQLHAEPQALAEPGTHLRSLEPVQWSAQFEIPADAPVTFSAKDNDVRWSVKLTIDAKGAPAWKEDAPFVVRPRRVVAAS